jgi:hypothetical protein
VISAEIVECVLKSPNPSGIAPNGPNGRGVAVLTRNFQNPDLPPPVGSTVRLKLSRSIIETTGSAIFAINFAAESTVSVDAERNVIGSDLDTNGGVSRPDLVHDSVTMRIV